ncbi:MAG: hypothetical protein GJ680_19115 [Alteromonadaceae bacterium]|nr:hypothetical protein [Alteromonadaceae bacterium]
MEVFQEHEIESQSATQKSIFRFAAPTPASTVVKEAIALPTDALAGQKIEISETVIKQMQASIVSDVFVSRHEHILGLLQGAATHQLVAESDLKALLEAPSQSQEESEALKSALIGVTQALSKHVSTWTAQLFAALETAGISTDPDLLDWMEKKGSFDLHIVDIPEHEYGSNFDPYQLRLDEGGHSAFEIDLKHLPECLQVLWIALIETIAHAANRMTTFDVIEGAFARYGAELPNLTEAEIAELMDAYDGAFNEHVDKSEKADEAKEHFIDTADALGVDFGDWHDRDDDDFICAISESVEHIKQFSIKAKTDALLEFGSAKTNARIQKICDKALDYRSSMHPICGHPSFVRLRAILQFLVKHPFDAVEECPFEWGSDLNITEAHIVGFDFPCESELFMWHFDTLSQYGETGSELVDLSNIDCLNALKRRHLAGVLIPFLNAEATAEENADLCV